jgi:hypothetical protein
MLEVLRSKYLLIYVTEGRIEVTERRGRRYKQLLDELTETIRQCTLKEEALDLTPWRTMERRGYGPVVRQTTRDDDVQE